MDYEKKYKEALERAKEIIECSKSSESKEVRMVLSFFPELKESEDERIRAALINIFKTHKDYEVFFGVSTEEILAWLEKQGKQKPIFDVGIPFVAKDSKLEEITYDIPEGFYARVEDNKVVIRKGEKPTEWSENKEFSEAVSEKIRNMVSKFFSGDGNITSKEFADQFAWELLTLARYEIKKEQKPTWKPSDEQIKAVKLARSFVVDDFDEHPALSEILIELEEQLKKLKD